MSKPKYIGYLGDGVYISSDLENGFPLVITTGHHEPHLADHRVYFEIPMLVNLITQLRLAYPDLFKS